MDDRDTGDIELVGIQQAIETDDRKRLGRKKDRVTIVDDDRTSIDQSEPGSSRLQSTAAVYTMHSPSIRDVLSPASGSGTADFGQVGSSYFDVCSITVPPTRSSAGGIPRTILKRDGFQEDDGFDSQQGEENEDHTETKPTKKIIISLIIVALIAATWTGSTQFSKSALSGANSFRAPYFLVWFNTNWMGVCFPFYVLLMAIVLACFKKKLTHAKSPYRVICDASLVFGPSGITLKAVLTRSIPFTILWILANYSYSQSLSHISSAETTTVFSSNLAFVYVLSWIFLHDAFVALRILAMLLAIIGIVLMVHADNLGTYTFIGVVCAVVAAAVAAIYKVLFKKVVGEANFGQVSLFMTMLGLCNLLLSWPITLTLLLTKAETVDWNSVPWPDICASAILNLLYNLFINVGIAYTHPVYISLGMFLGLPLNAAVDSIWRKIELKNLQIIGGVCILVSFLLMMLPENFASLILRRLGLTRQNRDVYIVTRPEGAQKR